MTNDSSASILSKVWIYAHILKKAGFGYGDYLEQITYLLLLKMADEMTELGKFVKRKETDHFKKFTCDEIVARNYRANSVMTTRAQSNLEILWLIDNSLEDSENLPPPAELPEVPNEVTHTIIASLETALEEFRGVEDALNPTENEP